MLIYILDDFQHYPFTYPKFDYLEVLLIINFGGDFTVELLLKNDFKLMILNV